MTLRLMCDSDTLADLIGTPVIATYADLVTTPAMKDTLQNEFPDSVIIYGARGAGDPLGIASWIDYENGDYTASQLRSELAGFLDRQVPYPTVYSDLSNHQVVEATLSGMGHYNWLAWWGHIEIPAYPDATVQFASAGTLGAHLDLSLIHNDRWNPSNGNPSWLSGVIGSLDTAGREITSALSTLQLHEQ